MTQAASALKGGRLALYTVGHSNHPLPRFLDLLGVEVRVLVDVRSVPSSRHAPHFGRRVLQRSLARAGIEYCYLGEELGGRPSEPGFYDEAGHVLYGNLALSPRFREGVARLLVVASGSRTAVFCAEEDPARCHRQLLIGRVLIGEGVDVCHIRGDGRIEQAAQEQQQALFSGPDPGWRSPRPVARPRS